MRMKLILFALSASIFFACTTLTEPTSKATPPGYYNVFDVQLQKNGQYTYPFTIVSVKLDSVSSLSFNQQATVCPVSARGMACISCLRQSLSSDTSNAVLYCSSGNPTKSYSIEDLTSAQVEW